MSSPPTPSKQPIFSHLDSRARVTYKSSTSPRAACHLLQPAHTCNHNACAYTGAQCSQKCVTSSCFCPHVQANKFRAMQGTLHPDSKTWGLFYTGLTHIKSHCPIRDDGHTASISRGTQVAHATPVLTAPPPNWEQHLPASTTHSWPGPPGEEPSLQADLRV